ncbi:MAG: imidazoleglycerol-phosphate dehydratase [Gemmatimonadales bacterium]|jgi:imidazoleglycerol-phosphate dehydratase|nr:MAG: imidazoleglycerol-phosphate dehydratase [Gemmatimonadales bacterium]
MTRLTRETGETRIQLDVRRTGGDIDVVTDEPFLTHMVVTLARYAGLGLTLEATGDLRHHLVEDVGITLGLALAREVPAEAERYGWASVPMDDALVRASLDLGGRPWFEGRLPSRLYEHFLQSLTVNLGATLHVVVDRGRDRHHVVEAAVKATGLALRQALREGEAVFSTKGSVRLEWGEDS